MTCSTEVLSEGNAHRWEEYNTRSGKGTLFHGLRWKRLLEDVLKVKLRYYLIFDGQKVVGLCPFAEQSAGFFRGLASIPHSEFNNLVLDDSFDSAHLNEILSLFAKEYSFLHLSTYDREVLDNINYNGFNTGETGNMVLNVKQKPPEEIWSSLSRNMRYKIQVFEKKGFKIREARQRSEIEWFYRYYVENLTSIKGDILPLSFLEGLLELFPGRVRIEILTNGDVFAGGSLTLLSPERKTAYYQYLALNRNLPNRYTPTYAIYWNLVNRTRDDGYEYLSFGRQRLDLKNPRFQDKAKFGAEHVPIHSRLVPLSRIASLAYQVRKRFSG